MASYPSPFQVGPSAPALTSQQQMLKDVQSKNGVYEIAANAPDAAQFANGAAAFFAKLKNEQIVSAGTGFANDLEYLQAVVRSAEGTAFYSKGTSNIGDVSIEDYSAIKNLLTQSYIRGEYWQLTAQKDIASPFRTTGGTFSKDITTALNLLDQTDAESKFRDAYFKAYNVYPSEKKITKFMNQFNAEAKTQLGVSTTTAVGGGMGKTGRRDTVTKGLGFTQAEQDQFLAQFLKDNYKITGKEAAGTASQVINSLKKAYANNMLPEDSMENMIAFAADYIGTSDQEVANQKLAAKIDSIRKTSAIQNPGIKEFLDSGNDASTIVDPIIQKALDKLGVKLDRNDKRIAQILNYNDGKTTRVMNSAELENFLEKQPEFQTSPTGINKYLGIGRALRSALG